jgi:phosphoribosyl-ATP pyrophosphohydrolase/phosphoribosyl-AMP cyclohydrolase
MELMVASADSLIASAKLDGEGLLPVIAQEISTGMVRMFAWANKEALEKTALSGKAHFWSRSRAALWQKGESSGNTMAVREIRLDCDGDVALYLVDPEGPSCHTGATSCFFRALLPDGTLAVDGGPPDPPALIVSRVAEIIARRRRERPERSYVVSLLDGGWPKILAKIREEAGELIEALPGADKQHTTHEVADLLFHVLVGAEAAGVPVADVFQELRGRFGQSGIDEKASRGAK